MTVTEGNSGTTNAVFTVTLGAISGRPVTVDYATADSSATSPSDYAATTGQLTFAPGQTTRTVTVLVNGDLVDEGTETYFLNLTNPGSATIVDNQGGGTIIDDDGEPQLSVNDVTVLESNTGSVNATFTVSLTPASGQTVSVGYSTQDGSATSPADYTGTGGSLVFTPGQTTRTFDVQVNGDLLDEFDENFTVHLSSPVNATIADDSGLGTITDNDLQPTLAIDNISVPEGNSGTVNATFTVSLNTPSGRAASVDYATADGSATAPADYAATGGSLSFAAGETTKTVTVVVNGDVLDEISEHFAVNLSNPSNATFGDALGDAAITDDDPLPALSIGDATVTEGDSGTVDATFTVTLAPVSGRKCPSSTRPPPAARRQARTTRKSPRRR